MIQEANNSNNNNASGLDYTSDKQNQFYNDSYTTVLLNLDPQSVLLQTGPQLLETATVQEVAQQNWIERTDGNTFQEDFSDFTNPSLPQYLSDGNDTNDTTDKSDAGMDYIKEEENNSNCASFGDVSNIAELSTHSERTEDLLQKVKAEEDILGDEPFALLQSLNSGNILAVSQQSAVEEVMWKHHLESKDNLNVLPTFVEHDNGGFGFHLDLSNKNIRKTNWVYSEKLNKIYIRMNELFTVNAVYTQKLPIQQLRLRVFICLVKEVSEPVLRCQNHLSKDTEKCVEKRECLLRCDNPSAVYCGVADGKSIKDRYSVLIPLDVNQVPRDKKTITEPIALKFTCQNSCFGRKDSNMVFILEGMTGEILAQRVLGVKVCSCPKRDKEAEERNMTCLKRKSLPDDANLISHDLLKKKAKMNHSLPCNGNSDSVINLETKNVLVNGMKNFDIQPTRDGYRVVMELQTKGQVQKVVDYACDVVGSSLMRESDLEHKSKKYRKLKNLYEAALTL